MTYANPLERRDLIAGLRALADLLESSADIPAPPVADVLVFPPNGPDEEIYAEVDRTAALIGAEVNDRTAAQGNYTASRRFGPVEYRAVAIPSRARAYHNAWTSYSGNVIPDTREEG
jgi:hypothetical protein